MTKNFVTLYAYLNVTCKIEMFVNSNEKSENVDTHKIIQ